ncbi:C-type mannose receptor 2-like isoform X2 [Dicentrarchus labrax]|uniref:C-type mannose receptor 2-like isoform X2 n=1 Tax=Dicentrarchus labrax TaxID=13489 RepID=UPI0021F55FB3|nr:C-type mannose receptor 2-like isoform X2 [Dicentrarchus labrax]
MERGMFGILVLSALCEFTPCLHHRQYHFNNEPKTWPEGQKYCREKHTDLASVSDEHDLEELAGLIHSDVPHVFLGLYRSWGWSMSDADDYKEGEVAYWKWASGQPKTHYCGSIGSTGEWFAADCKSNLNFFCYNGSTTDISQRFTLGNGFMNWLDAQAYCRKLHTDLARVRNQLENEQLQRTVNNSPVWIGLTGMSWIWSDGSEPSFTPWRLIRGLGDCSVLMVNSDPLVMKDLSCDEKLPFFCYTDPRRKHLMRLQLTADDNSVDIKDLAVREAVLKWVTTLHI